MNFKEFKLKYKKKEVEIYPNQVMNNPLISVCVQTYQHGDYIKMCLNSILMQKTNFTYEILIYDDASQDNTAAIIREDESKFRDTIKPIYQTETHYSKELV